MKYITPPWHAHLITMPGDLVNLKSTLKFKRVTAELSVDRASYIFNVYFENPDHPLVVYGGEYIVVDPWGQPMVRSKFAMEQMFKDSLKV